MSSNRISLLALLAAAGMGCAGVDAHPAAISDVSITSTPAEIIASLRASVQERYDSVLGRRPEGIGVDEIRRHMAQFFNFPNFGNMYCFRGYWRNC
jgi:hypothetical protein